MFYLREAEPATIQRFYPKIESLSSKHAKSFQEEHNTAPKSCRPPRAPSSDALFQGSQLGAACPTGLRALSLEPCATHSARELQLGAAGRQITCDCKKNHLRLQKNHLRLQEMNHLRLFTPNLACHRSQNALKPSISLGREYKSLATIFCLPKTIKSFVTT